MSLLGVPSFRHRPPCGEVAMDLTDAQWERVAPMIPNPPRRKDGRGRPRRERREVLAGVLWILRTGAQWAEVPGRYPPYQTCHRYFQQWCRDGTLKGLLHALAQDLYERGEIDISEAFIDGTFAGAKKGALPSGRRSAGRGPRSWQLTGSERPPRTVLGSKPPGDLSLRSLSGVARGHIRLIRYAAVDAEPVPGWALPRG